MKMKMVKVENLQPGMMIDEWDLDTGAAAIVKNVTVIERPGYKYNVVRVETRDGSMLRPSRLVGSKVQIAGEVH